MTIQLLPTDVAAKIAAGEVVERPANVAKELIENSLDAQATEIRIEIRDGGQRLFRITDNGIGMTPDEAPLAFERHATSKLRTADDLNRIGTFGFRGEALYSISAVSQVTLMTCAASTSESHAKDQVGTRLRIEGGQIVDQSRVGTPPGTILTIENIFYNMPARLKFLRQPATEAGRISAVVQRYALAYPERRFSLVNNGKLVFQSTGSGKLFDVLVKLYGLENAKQMVPIGASNIAVGSSSGPGLDADVDFMDGGGFGMDSQGIDRRNGRYGDPAIAEPTALPTISGYVSLPTLTRANRNNIDLFVNRRYIEDRSLTYAVIQAFHTLLPGGRFPIGAIFIDLDPSKVDVNVHPQKIQVRFVEERRIYNAVQKAVRRAIVDNAPVPDMNLDSRGRHSGNHDPFQQMDQWTTGSDWVERRRTVVNAGKQQPLDLYIPPPPNPPNLTPAPERAPLDGFPTGKTHQQDAIERSSDDGDEVGNSSSAPATAYPSPEPLEPTYPVPADPADTNASSTNPSTATSLAAQVSTADPETGQMPDATAQQEAQKPSGQLPPLRVVGQVGAMYIVTEGPEGLFLIDQHAAHERILYEKFMLEKYNSEQASTKGMAGAAGSVAQQALLEPLTLHAGTQMAGFVAQYTTELNAFGFEIEPFGGDTFLVRAVPAVLAGQDPLRILEEIVNGLRSGRNMVGEELEARLVKMICKRASIKAGQLLSDLEMQELIRQLEACQSPRTCPHGRPTMIQLSAGELEKAFGRIK
ncbi:MAG: DNA mismatch repair endonuclease MutL [Chloroflexota bacterium]